MNDFYVLDVETANPDRSSICQVGVAKFSNNQLEDTWKSYVNPQDYFDEHCINVHGIDEEKVKDAPTFPEIYEELRSLIENRPVAHHTAFDTVAISRACGLYQLDEIPARWIDSSRIARRCWKEFSKKGYGLTNLTQHFEIKYKAHDALEDAIATGKIVIKAFEDSGVQLDDWYTKINQRITKAKYVYKPNLTLEGNPDGPLYGENLIFTGSLSITRAEAAQIAAELGCNVTDSVTRKTTLLVVGAQDEHKLAGYTKSSKHRKAE